MPLCTGNAGARVRFSASLTSHFERMSASAHEFILRLVYREDDDENKGGVGANGTNEQCS